MHQVASRCPRELAPFGAHRSSLGESESGGVVGSATRAHRPSSAGNDRHNRQERRDGPNPPPPPLEYYGPRTHTHTHTAQVARCFRPRMCSLALASPRKGGRPRARECSWWSGILGISCRTTVPFGVVPGVCGKWELTNVRRQCPESRARRQATGVRPGCCECARRRSWDFANADEHGACCSL